MWDWSRLSGNGHSINLLLWATVGLLLRLRSVLRCLVWDEFDRLFVVNSRIRGLLHSSRRCGSRRCGFARAHESDDVAEVEDNSVEAVPDHHIEDWFDHQIEDWLDIYAGFLWYFRRATTSECSSQDLENVELKNSLQTPLLRCLTTVWGGRSSLTALLEGPLRWPEYSSISSLVLCWYTWGEMGKWLSVFGLRRRCMMGLSCSV